MNPRPEMSPQEIVNLTRRDFLASTGMGTLALASLLAKDGFHARAATTAGTAPSGVTADPLAPKSPHFEPRAKNCILIYFEGAPSQLDLFDPKPKLIEMDGQKLPDSLLEKVRFAFITRSPSPRGSRAAASRAVKSSARPTRLAGAWSMNPFPSPIFTPRF